MNVVKLFLCLKSWKQQPGAKKRYEAVEKKSSRTIRKVNLKKVFAQVLGIYLEGPDVAYAITF